MIIEALAILGGLYLIDEFTTQNTILREETILRENWKDKAGIQWTPEELCKVAPGKRIVLFGYDPLK